MKTPWQLERRDDGWWVIMPPYLDCGPYRTKAEAVDDAKGVHRFDLANGNFVAKHLFDIGRGDEQGQLTFWENE